MFHPQYSIKYTKSIDEERDYYKGTSILHIVRVTCIYYIGVNSAYYTFICRIKGLKITSGSNYPSLMHVLFSVCKYIYLQPMLYTLDSSITLRYRMLCYVYGRSYVRSF